ncbi:MAG: GNAT family N-acetyltransferase [Firmicutes bacterium]|nr:GNAT family N-acetyltransferase [Bacillota bacterium]
MTNLTVRAATPDDAAAICMLVRELAEANGEETSATPEFVSQYLCTPACAALAAEADGRVIGFLSYYIHPNLYHAGPTALIEELVVSGDMRGAGVGERLVVAAIEAAKRAGCQEISVSTMYKNERAQRFYRRLGFRDDALLLEIHFDRADEGGPVREDGSSSTVNQGEDSA